MYQNSANNKKIALIVHTSCHWVWTYSVLLSLPTTLWFRLFCSIPCLLLCLFYMLILSLHSCSFLKFYVCLFTFNCISCLCLYFSIPVIVYTQNSGFVAARLRRSKPSFRGKVKYYLFHNRC